MIFKVIVPYFMSIIKHVFVDNEPSTGFEKSCVKPKLEHLDFLVHHRFVVKDDPYIVIYR
jgi:hypothetical protein